MKTKKIPTWYYEQFDTNLNLQYPAKGFGGWQKKVLNINLSKTGFVFMHIWNPHSPAKYKGLYNAVEYLPRVKNIVNTSIKPLLKSLRKNNIKIYHIVDEKYINTSNLLAPIKDDVIIELENFKKNFVFPGANNIDNCNNYKRESLLVENDEPTLHNSEELHKLCLKDNINHLIYSGFAINWCLQYSPGNMNEMHDRGFMCSAIKETTTAVENKESVENQLNKQYALWLIAIKHGFIYELNDILAIL